MTSLALNHIFATKKLSALPKPPNGLIVIDANSPLAKAAEILSSNHIQSAPIYDPANPQSTQLPEVLDMIAVMTYIVDQAKTAETPLNGFIEFATELEGFELVTVKQIMKPSAGASIVPLTESSTLLDAMLVMGHFNIRRIPVLAESLTGGIQNYVTQMSVVKEIAALCDKGEFSLELTLESAGLAFGNVISVKQSTPFLEALTIMHANSISGVPVVDDDGVILGNISASDCHFIIRFPILFEMITRSHMSIKDYQTTLEESGEATRTPITVHPGCTIRQVITTMLTEHIHRVYVVDGNNRPVGVVSLGNVIKTLVDLPPDFLQKFVLGGV